MSQSPENPESPNNNKPEEPVKKEPTPQQGHLFDLSEGKAARDAGMELAAGNRPVLLKQAKQIAVEVAITRESRTVTADDVQLILIKRGHHPEELGNAAGSIFKDRKIWKRDGHELSKRKTNHARSLVRWLYVGDVPR